MLVCTGSLGQRGYLLNRGPWNVRISATPLPGGSGLQAGELNHSNYSN